MEQGETLDASSGILQSGTIKIDGGTINGADDNEVTIPLYAVHYKPNGGTEEEVIKYQHANTSLEDAPDFTREGYTLIGWATTKDGSAVTDYTIKTEKNELYAVWAKDLVIGVTTKDVTGQVGEEFSSQSIAISDTEVGDCTYSVKTESPLPTGFILNSETGELTFTKNTKLSTATQKDVIVEIKPNSGAKGGELTLKFKIAKGVATLTWEMENNKKFAYTGNQVTLDPAPSINAPGMSDATVTLEYKTYESTYTQGLPTDVGTYNIKASFTNVENYEVVTPIEKTIIITPTSVNGDTWNTTWKDIWSTNASVTYGDNITTKIQEQVPDKITYDNEEYSPNKDNLTYSTSEDGTFNDNVPTNAGTYYVKVPYKSNNHTAEIVKEFTITPATATIKWTWGEGWNTTGTNPTYTYNNSNVIVATPTVTTTVSETLSVTELQYKKDGEAYSTVAKKDVGIYTVKANINSTNYTLTDAEQIFVIAQATTSITWGTGWDAIFNSTNNANVYDAEAIDEGVAKPTVLIDGQNVEVTLSYTNNDGATIVAPTNIGNYKVTASYDANANYEPFTATKEFSIVLQQQKSKLGTRLGKKLGKKLRVLIFMVKC